MKPFIEQIYKTVKVRGVAETFLPTGRWIIRKKTPFQCMLFRLKRFMKTAKLSTLTGKTL